MHIRKILLQNEHIRISGEAGDGDEALARFRRLQPDAVVMNICMPKRDGIAVTRELCRMKPGTNIIILTVQNDPKYRTAAYNAGASDYLLKPPDQDELIRSVLKSSGH